MRFMKKTHSRSRRADDFRQGFSRYRGEKGEVFEDGFPFRSEQQAVPIYKADHENEVMPHHYYLALSSAYFELKPLG